MSCIWPPAGSPDPFHVVHLAAGRLTMVRCRLQREATGRRGVKGERLYDCRRALLKTASLRTPRQRERVDTLLADPVNDALRLAHGVYQRIIACYRHKDPRLGRRMMGALIDALAEPAATRRCPELRSLGRTLKRRRGPTGPPKPSTAASRPCAASPWDSTTSNTTANEASSTPEESKTSLHTKKGRARFLSTIMQRKAAIASRCLSRIYSIREILNKTVLNRSTWGSWHISTKRCKSDTKDN